MNESEFQSRAVSVFHNRKYFFDEDFQQGRGVTRPSTGFKVMYKAGMFAAGGAIAALGTGFPKFKDEDVFSAVAKLRGLSDFAGLRMEPAGAILALFIYADALPDETIIGKSLLIRDEIKNFKQFGLKIAFAKGSVFADVFFVFQSSDKCLHFRHSVQERCKHVEFFAKVYALPWCIDLSAKSVWPYSGHPFIALRPLKPSQIEAGLFC
jgi:hypothetical protein